MTVKALFTSKGTISAIVESPRRTTGRSKVVTEFGPVLKRGEKYESLTTIAGMSRIIAAADLNKLKVIKKAGAFQLSGSLLSKAQGKAKIVTVRKSTTSATKKRATVSKRNIVKKNK